jgi:4a-hydroxytetrahydrobiopterin dehydratase
MKMARLSEQEIARQLPEVPGWQRVDQSIRRVFELPSFKEAIDFVTRVATLADEADHHPDILIEYRKVTLTLSTHDAGGLSARDFALARQIPEP